MTLFTAQTKNKIPQNLYIKRPDDGCSLTSSLGIQKCFLKFLKLTKLLTDKIWLQLGTLFPINTYCPVEKSDYVFRGLDTPPPL